jgi:hypothetical protein
MELDSEEVNRPVLSTVVEMSARGIRSRRDSQPSNRKLSATEEETLIQWILSTDQRLRRHPYDGQRTFFLLNGRNLLQLRMENQRQKRKKAKT